MIAKIRNKSKKMMKTISLKKNQRKSYKDVVFVVRLKKRGLRPYVWRISGKSLAKVRSIIIDFVNTSHHDCFWTICDQTGCEIRRYKHIIK